jgi:hypothetical protein
MNAAFRRLRSEARQLTRGKVPTAIRYPAPFRAAVATSCACPTTPRPRLSMHPSITVWLPELSSDWGYKIPQGGSLPIRLTILAARTR